METYFQLEDFAKNVLLNSKKEEEIERWQKILELNKINGKYLNIN